MKIGRHYDRNELCIYYNYDKSSINWWKKKNVPQNPKNSDDCKNSTYFVAMKKSSDNEIKIIVIRLKYVCSWLWLLSAENNNNYNNNSTIIIIIIPPYDNTCLEIPT